MTRIKKQRLQPRVVEEDEASEPSSEDWNAGEETEDSESENSDWLEGEDSREDRAFPVPERILKRRTRNREYTRRYRERLRREAAEAEANGVRTSSNLKITETRIKDRERKRKYRESLRRDEEAENQNRLEPQGDEEAVEGRTSSRLKLPEMGARDGIRRRNYKEMLQEEESQSDSGTESSEGEDSSVPKYINIRTRNRENTRRYRQNISDKLRRMDPENAKQALLKMKLKREKVLNQKLSDGKTLLDVRRETNKQRQRDKRQRERDRIREKNDNQSLEDRASAALKRRIKTGIIKECTLKEETELLKTIKVKTSAADNSTNIETEENRLFAELLLVKLKMNSGFIQDGLIKEAIRVEVLPDVPINIDDDTTTIDTLNSITISHDKETNVIGANLVSVDLVASITPVNSNSKDMSISVKDSQSCENNESFCWRDLISDDESDGEENDDAFKNMKETPFYNEENEADNKRHPDETIDDWVNRMSTFISEHDSRKKNTRQQRKIANRTKPKNLKKPKPMRISEEEYQRICWETKMNIELLRIESNHKKVYQKLEEERSTPEDIEKRKSLDEQRKKLEQIMLVEKTNLLEKVKAQLKEKLEQFSKETLEERTNRIKHQLDQAKDFISKILETRRSKSDAEKKTAEDKALARRERRKRLHDINKQKHLNDMTPEEKQAKKDKAAADARIRTKMERREYEVFMILENCTGFEDLKHAIMTEELNQSTVEYWGNYNSSMCCKEMQTYRKLFLELVTMMRSNNFFIPEQEDSHSQHQNQLEMQEKYNSLKEFIKTGHDAIKDHLWKKRYYLKDYYKKREQGLGKKAPLTEEEKERRRLRQNANIRQRYQQKKLGLDLGVGGYMRTRISNRNSKGEASTIKKKIQAEDGPSQSRPKNKKIQRKPRKTTVRGGRKLKKGYSSSKDAELASSNNSNSSNSEDLSHINEHSEMDSRSDGEFPDHANTPHQDRHHDNNWMPLATFEVDAVLPNEIVNARAGLQNQQSFQVNNFNSHQQLHHQPNVAQNENYLGRLLYSQYHGQSNIQTNATGLNYRIPNQDTAGHSLFPVNPQQTLNSSTWNSNLQPIRNAHSSNYSQYTQQFGSMSTTITPIETPPNQNASASRPTFANMPSVVPDIGEEVFVNESESLIDMNVTTQPQLGRRGRPKGSTNKQPKESGSTLKVTTVDQELDNSTITPAPVVPTTPIVPNIQLIERSLQIENLRPRCVKCDIFFTSQDKLNQHLESQTCSEESTLMTDVSISDSNQNTETEQTNETSNYKSKEKCEILSKQLKRWECKICPLTFKKLDSLRTHIGYIHFEKRVHQCPICPEKKLTKRIRENLRKHIRTRHPAFNNTFVLGIFPPMSTFNASRFLCTCRKLFDNYMDLMKHFEEVHDKMKYSCNYCGILLQQSDHLLDHVKLFHPKESIFHPDPPKEIDSQDIFNCDVCDSKFLSHEHLDNHKSRGHKLVDFEDSSKVKKWQCTYCDRRFCIEEKRDRHERECTTQIYFCYRCRKRFPSKAKLKHHTDKNDCEEIAVNAESALLHNSTDMKGSEKIKVRNIYEPYKCELCRRSFMSLFPLRYHFLFDHNLTEYLQLNLDDNSSESLWDSLNCSDDLENPNFESNANEGEDQGQDENPNHVTAELESDPNTEQDHSSGFYQCPECNQNVLYSDFHRFHKTYGKLIKRYCKECNRCLSRNGVLIIHNRTAHGINDPSSPINNYDEYRNDPLKKDNEDQSTVFSCPTCLVEFNAQQFHRHHSFFPKDPDEKFCNNCNMNYFGSIVQHTLKCSSSTTDEQIPVRSKSRPVKAKVIIQLTEQDYENLSASTTISSAKGSLEIWTCRSCLKNYKTKEFLRQHISDAHSKDAFSRELCDLCNRTFASKNNLQKHKKFYHKKNLFNYKCTHCDFATGRVDHVREHLQNVHKVLNVPKAKLKKVPNPIAQQDHQNEELNKIVCDLCSKTFPNVDKLKTHMSNIHFKMHFTTFCEYCGLQMIPEQIYHHVSVVHGIRNVRGKPGDTNPQQTICETGRKKSLGRNRPKMISLFDTLKQVLQIRKESSNISEKSRAERSKGKGKRGPRRKPETDVFNCEDESDIEDIENENEGSSSDSSYGEEGFDNCTEDETSKTSLKNLFIKPEKDQEVKRTNLSKSNVRSSRKYESNTEEKKKIVVRKSRNTRNRKKTAPKYSAKSEGHGEDYDYNVGEVEDQDQDNYDNPPMEFDDSKIAVIILERCDHMLVKGERTSTKDTSKPISNEKIPRTVSTSGHETTKTRKNRKIVREETSTIQKILAEKDSEEASSSTCNFPSFELTEGDNYILLNDGDDGLGFHLSEEEIEPYISTSAFI